MAKDIRVNVYQCSGDALKGTHLKNNKKKQNMQAAKAVKMAKLFKKENRYK